MIKTLEDFETLTATEVLIRMDIVMIHKYRVTDVEVYRATIGEFWWEFRIVDTHVCDWYREREQDEGMDADPAYDDELIANSPNRHAIRFMLFDVLSGLMRERGLWFRQFSKPGVYPYAGRPETDSDKKKLDLDSIPGLAV